MSYKQTYFKIICGEYRLDGWRSAAGAAAFTAETLRLFTDAGWTAVKDGGGGACNRVRKGKQELYLHPLQFVGVVREEEVQEIEAMLSWAKTFCFWGTNTQYEYLELSDEEYLAWLDAQRSQIEAALLECYESKRKGVYISADQGTHIVWQFTLHRFSDKWDSREMAKRFIVDLIKQMIGDGRLEAARTIHGLGLRTVA